MPIKKQFLFCLLLVLTNILSTHAQKRFDVPKSVELKYREDSIKYESAVIAAVKWLEETDLNKETNKRKEVNNFVWQWISTSHTVDIDIKDSFAKLYDKNEQLLGIYIASYARNFLENKRTATTFSATKAGLISIMNVYNKGIDISQNKEMDKLIELTTKNKLDDYINENFQVDQTNSQQANL